MYKNLHGWLITYNEYTNKFSAAKSENKEELFSGNKGNVISSSSINTLIEIIEKTNGDLVKLGKLVSISETY